MPINSVIAQLTIRQLLARRRWLMVTLLAALPVVMALLFRLYNVDDDALTFMTSMMSDLILTVCVPVIALVLASAGLGAEVDDGTVVYLLTKPIARTTIVTTKIVVIAGVAALLNVVSVLLAGAIALNGLDATHLVIGFAVGAALGSALYAALFLTLGLLTRRGMLIGLVYLVVWEGTLSGLFSGTRTLSIRQYMLSTTAAISHASAKIFSAPLPSERAWIMSGVIAVLCVAYSIHRLRSFEVGQTG